MKKISLIIPCYNSEKYILKCFHSLSNQTFKDFEIIFINDGSTDNTLSILKSIEDANRDFVKVINLEENKGLGNARNVGMDNTNSKYIMFLDSDDYMDIDLIEKMYNKISEDNFDMVECNYIWEYPNKKTIDNYREYKNTKEMLLKIRVVAWNKIYSRKFINKVKPLFAVGLKYEDILFTYEYIPFINKTGFIDNSYIHYVQRKNSLINNQNESVRDIIEVLTQVKDYYIDKNLFKDYNSELEYIFIRYLLGSSYKRAVCIKDRSIRKTILKESLSFLNKCFPNWKKNIYLKNKSIKNIYFKSINKITYYLYVPIVKVLRRKI